jgi:hypothetical protein
VTDRNVDVHLVVSYSPVTGRFTFERMLSPVIMDGRQVYDWATRTYQRNDENNNLELISDAATQLESALRVINTVPRAA